MDVASHRLWRGDSEIRLRPKSWDVLFYLVERPGLLLTKEAFHRDIWGATAVSDDTLTQSIGELRRALGDNRLAPRFIETVHGRGFRFIAAVSAAEDRPRAADTRVEGAAGPVLAAGPAAALPFAGRRAELGQLDESLRRAQRAARQVVFVTGEAGIGKTTLVEEFLQRSAHHVDGIRLLHGQCVQQHGQREPYMPMLEALERGLNSPEGRALIPQLTRLAPNWYGHMPSLAPEGEPARAAVSIHGAPERMLREIGTFLEAMAARSTVILVLEDLHWSDAATVDLLTFVAQRPDPARLLVVGTYRPAEASVHDHPIREAKQTLRLRRRCAELQLDYLSAAEIGDSLRGRFGQDLHDLAARIHQRTDGNPLFLVAVVDELTRRGHLAQVDDGWVLTCPVDQIDLSVPDDVLEMVAFQCHGLSADERAIVETGSVSGMEFDARILARVTGRDADDVERVLQHLAGMHRVLMPANRRTGQASGERYRFVHALHRQVLYGQVPEQGRRRLHQAIGEALEQELGERAADLAPELSAHFEASGDLVRAVRYLTLCVARAQPRFAYHEAAGYAEHAIELLRRLPAGRSRDAQELGLRLLLGSSLGATHGYTSNEVKENYQRARPLCEVVGDARQLFEVVTALSYSQLDGTEEGMRRSLDELSRVAASADAPDLRSLADLFRGRMELWVGNVREAVHIMSTCLAGEESRPIEPQPAVYGIHPVIGGLLQYGLALWFSGSPDQARSRVDRAVAHAEKLGQPFELAGSVCQSGLLELLCGDVERAGLLAARALALCADNRVAYFVGPAQLVQGASLAEQGDLAGGIAEMRRSLMGQQATSGSFFCDVILAFLAAAHGGAEQWDTGLGYVAEGLALSEARYERVYTAELWRIRGELLLGKARSAKGARARGPGADEAEPCFRRALEIARGQGARSLELRAAMSLARLSMRRDQARGARDLLRSVYASFTEGFDTKDLRDANALLARLGS